MSDFLTPDEYEQHKKLRDTRFAKVARSDAIKTELRDSTFVNALLAATQVDAERAMEELAETSPLAAESIALQLVKVRTLVYIRRVLTGVLRAGAAAEEALRAEDSAHNGGE